MGLFGKTWEQQNRPRGRTNFGLLGREEMGKENIRPADMPGKSVKEKVANYYAEGERRGQLIKESRDPKLQRGKQLSQRESAKAKAERELEKSGAKPDALTPESLWSDEPGMARTTFTERTGKKVEMPKGTEVGAVSREVQTPEGGLVRQIAGPAGFGSIKMSKEAADRLAKQRDREERQALAVAGMREKGAKIRANLEKQAGEASIAKRESWEVDKRAFAEGQQIQREARRRLTRVNRALRGAPDFDRTGRRSEGYGTTLSNEEFNNLLEEQAMLKNIINRRETLKEKGITDIGRQAEANRQAQITEAENIRRANEARALASGYGVSGVQAQREALDPYYSAMEEFYKSMFTNISGGYGIPGLSYPQGPSGS